MSDNLYLYLLIVCGFLCQGIIAKSPANNISRTEDFLVRHKRVINHEPGGQALVRISAINYIVNIRRNTRMHCVGAILSRFTVITAAKCVEAHLVEYLVQSGSAYAHRSIDHNITSRALHYGNPPHVFYDGIALIKVSPTFVLGPNVGIINLHVEPVLTGSLAVVSGWGSQHPTSSPMTGHQKLRSITLPIMNHRECVANYAGHFQITNKHICTYCELKLCANNDLGAPLVIDGSVTGIHNFKGNFVGIKNPDVFIDVQHPDYSVWIRENTQYSW